MIARMMRLIRHAVIVLSYLLSCAGLAAQEPLPPSVEDRQEAGEASAGVKAKFWVLEVGSA